MLTVEGVYRNGTVELPKLPTEIGQTRVLVTFLESVEVDLVARGIKANEIINRVAPLFGARGGGKPQLAQAGSKETQKIEADVAQAKGIMESVVI